MSGVQFTTKQVQLLNNLMDKMKKDIMVSMSNKLSKKELEKVLDNVLTTGGLDVSNNSSNKSSNNKSPKNKSPKNKSPKNKSSKKKTGYMKWLWSPNGMNVIKNENKGKEQKELFKEAGKKWQGMSAQEKSKYD